MEFKLWWIDADRQGSIDMGTYLTRTAALAQIPIMEAELLAQCANKEHRDRILDGDFEVEEVDS